MTVKTRYSFQPRDIQAVQFECSHCHATVTVPLNETVSKDPKDAAYRCAVCQTPWLNEKKLKLEAIEGLLKGLKEFSRDEDNGFELRFEIASLENKSPEK